MATRFPRSNQITAPAIESQEGAGSPKSAPVHSDKAAAVLAGARAVFLAHGFSAATTDMIQQASGVSKSTVYAYYSNKEALFEAVIEAECAAFLQSARQINFSSGNVRTVLELLGRAYLDIVLSPAGLALFRAVVAEAPRFPNLARHFYLVGPQVMNGIVAKHLDEAAKNGEIDFSVVGRDVAATVFVNLVRAEAQMQCLTHPDSSPSAAQHDQWVEVAVTTFLRAYGTS
jgi:TetR/AcrR family transcriptional regulator, mexJK operon transcriptional repressor